MAGEAAGTIAYMAPEQLRNFRDVRPQSDIYGIGMTAYSLLTGEMALDLAGKTSVAETVKAIFEQPLIPLAQRAPQLPRALCEVIDRALHKDQTQRWQSAVGNANCTPAFRLQCEPPSCIPSRRDATLWPPPCLGIQARLCRLGAR